MSNTLRTLLTTLAVGLSISIALSPAAQSQELRIAMGADVTSMDPHYVNLFPNNNIAEHVFEKLITLDPDSRLIPGVAESWKAINPTTWEFKLRKGVKFHDGSDFTAEDVAFSIDRVGKIPDSPGPFTTYTKAIKEVQIVDPLTIRFVTRHAGAAAAERHPHDLPRLEEDGDRRERPRTSTPARR